MTQRGAIVRGFRLGDTIGEGSYGKFVGMTRDFPWFERVVDVRVRLAESVVSDHQVAVKVMPTTKISFEDARKEVLISAIIYLYR